MNAMSTNDPLIERLDTLIRLVALGLCQEKSQKEQVAFLSGVGMKPKAIAEILGTTANTVNVTLSGMRKAGKSKPAKFKRRLEDGELE